MKKERWTRAGGREGGTENVGRKKQKKGRKERQGIVVEGEMKES